MLVLNFSHPLTQAQIAQLEAMSGDQVEEVRDIPTHFDVEAPFVPQIVALADACHLSSEAWQTTPLVIVPPALNFIAVALIAELHGRMGYFPTIVRLRPVPEQLPPRYEIAELLNLQAIREAARRRR